MVVEREFTASDLSRALSRSFVLHVAGRVVEALAIGWLAAAAVLACEALQPGAGRPGQVWLAAGIAGACAAAAAWIEHAPVPREHLRTVDRRLDWNGALVTAADVSGDAGGGTLAVALVRSIGARLSRADLARASLPSTPLALVAMLLGAAVWFGARDFAARADEQALVHQTVPLDADQRSALGEAARTLSTSTQSAASRQDRGAEARRSVAHALDSAARAPAVGQEERRELTRRLEELLDGQALADVERESLARALAALGTSASSKPAHGPDPSLKSGPDTSSSSGALASGATPGKMGGSDPRTNGSQQSSAPRTAPDAVEPGVGPLRWWPARHDAVVEAWLASAPTPK